MKKAIINTYLEIVNTIYYYNVIELSDEFIKIH